MQQSRTTPGRRRLVGACFPVVVLVLVAATLTACSQASAAPPAKPPWLLALPGDASVGAHWGAPAKGAMVTSYTVTASPGGRTCKTGAAARS